MPLLAPLLVGGDATTRREYVRAEHGTPYPDPLALLVYDQVEQVADAVIASLADRLAPVETVEIERIQDEVERQLMTHEHFNVVRRYILYR